MLTLPFASLHPGIMDVKDQTGQAPPQASGVQSVRRSAALLRALSRTPGMGARLIDLAEALALDRTSVHRLLQTLADEGLVEQDRTSKRYHLGLDFFSLAAAASNRYDIQEVATTAVAKLADELGDTVFFSLRSHYDSICVDANKGSFPVRILAMDIGARTPLGAGATGIAFLAPLPDDEVQEVLQHNAARLAKYQGHSAERVSAAIQRFREIGFAFEDGGSSNGVHAIAVPLADRRGRPLTVLTVAASADRMPLHRRSTIAATMQAESGRIAEAMWRKPDASRHRFTWLAATRMR
jgi:DNA-binding IclR family transcriptional regulator